MHSNNPEYLTSSFFCLLLLNDPDSVKKVKFNDENHYKVLYILELEKIYNELINFYYLRLNNLIGKLGFMNRKILKNGKGGFKYEFDIEQFNKFIELYENKVKNKMIEEEKKKYDADDEKEENKKPDDTDEETETEDEDPPPLDDPQIIDIFINGYGTQIQVY